MSTPNIVMARIDERLVHGQGALWVKSLGVNTVIVANDEVSEDHISQSLMKTALSSSIAARFFSVQKVIDVIHKASPQQTIFLVVKDCKEKITRSIFLGEEDKATLRKMVNDYNITFNTVTTPGGNDGCAPVDIKKYL